MTFDDKINTDNENETLEFNLWGNSKNKSVSHLSVDKSNESAKS